MRLSLSILFFHCSAHPRHLPSFPTRRSSDLARRNGGQVFFAVKDTGPGIAPEDIVRIFQEFEQTSTARDRKSTRLNSSHRTISYAVFCLKKKKRLIMEYTLYSDKARETREPI